MGKNYNYLTENEPLFYKKGYTKAKKNLSGVGDEELQAIARAGDDDLDSAFAKVGMGVGVDYYPLTSMGQPFKVTFEYKSMGPSVPVSWMGEKSSVEGKTLKEETYNATIWLAPDSFKKIKSGNVEKEYYKFKVINVNGEKPTSDFLFFKADEININDKVTNEVSPRLILDKKYTIGLKLGDVKPTEGSEGDQEDDKGGDDTKEIPIPKEISSGKNRNEIFRLLLNTFGNYKGSVVYGDGFKSPEEAREYGKIQRAVKSGKEDKSKLKDFREKAGRDSYSMMISNLRKSYPKNFMSRLEKAFPEFNIQYSKESVDESTVKQSIMEEENNDKYKRWSIVFPGKVISDKVIDSLDKNIKDFMSTAQKWFAVPVKIGGKTHGYKISYDKDKVNDYWKKFYGSKKESKLTLFNVLNEVVGGTLKEEDKKEKAQLIFNRIFIKGMKKGQKNQDSEINTDSIIMGKGEVQSGIRVESYNLDEKYINEIKEGAKKAGILDEDVNDIVELLSDLKNQTLQAKHDTEKVMIKLGKTKLGKNLYLNIPLKDNGKNVKSLDKLLGVGSEFKNCGFAIARPNAPFVKDGINIKLKLTK